ncbi:MAG: hypothetical protein HDR02_08800 [Lachnospiraceae bacterium]|nr:hypothetical protein [Lachnospiraceae bacterium]
MFPVASETGDTKGYLVSLTKISNKEKNYELMEYINDINCEYAEVLAESRHGTVFHHLWMDT